MKRENECNHHVEYLVHCNIWHFCFCLYLNGNKSFLCLLVWQRQWNFALNVFVLGPLYCCRWCSVIYCNCMLLCIFKKVLIKVIPKALCFYFFSMVPYICNVVGQWRRRNKPMRPLLYSSILYSYYTVKLMAMCEELEPLLAHRVYQWGAVHKRHRGTSPSKFIEWLIWE